MPMQPHNALIAVDLRRPGDLVCAIGLKAR